MYNIVDNIIMNEVICESPAATLTKLQEIVHLEESRKAKRSTATPALKAAEEPSAESASALLNESAKKGKKKNRRGGPICENGKHNEEVKSHTADQCWQIHPKLRDEYLARRNVGQPTTQLVEGDEGHESDISALLTKSVSKPIVLDTGATHHMINDPSVFKRSGETNIRISTGGHSNFLNATAIGSAVLVNHNGDQLILENVLLVPNLNRSLISIPRLFNHTFQVTKYKNGGAVVDIDKGFLLNGTVKHHLLELLDAHFLSNANESLLSCYLSSPVSPDWHARLGHPSAKYQHHLIPGSVSSECSICKECKLKALPFNSHFKKVDAVLDAIHMDLVGPFPTQSRSGYLYFLTLIDQFSGYRSVKFVRSKSNAFGRFKDFKAESEKQTGRVLRMLVSDGGGEFINEDFRSFCASEGIVHHVSPAYAPQNNGMAEQANQTILVKA
jgi:hypothetical protein